MYAGIDATARDIQGIELVEVYYWIYPAETVQRLSLMLWLGESLPLFFPAYMLPSAGAHATQKKKKKKEATSHHKLTSLKSLFSLVLQLWPVDAVLAIHQLVITTFTDPITLPIALFQNFTPRWPTEKLTPSCPTTLLMNKCFTHYLLDGLTACTCDRVERKIV